MPSLTQPKALATFARFASVGASGVVLNGVLFGLLSAAHTPSLAAGAIAFEGTLASNFVLNQRWTFATRGAAWPAAFAGYQFATLGAFALQLAVLQVLALGGVPAPLANLLGNASAMVWNVVVSARWTWRAAAEPAT